MPSNKKIDNIKLISSYEDENKIKNFYVRVRLENNIIVKSEVYCDGFKVFSVGNPNLITDFDKDNKFTKFNSSNINRVGKKSNLTNEVVTKEKLCRALEENRNLFYDKCYLKEVTFKDGDEISKKSEAHNKISKYIKSINQENEKYTCEVIDNLSIDDEYELACILFKEYKTNNSNVFKSVKFKYSRNLYKDKNKIFDENLVHKLETLMSNYENFTKFENEKKYQHQFLVTTTKINKDKDEISDLIPFEEEYFIVDGKEKEGRIDCIFYKKDNNMITDIYLIEIKVDEEVLGGSNGLHKHISDIKKLYKNNKAQGFYKRLLKQINDRRKELFNEEYKNDFESSNIMNTINCNFVVIVGKTSSDFDMQNYLDLLNEPKEKLVKNKMAVDIKEEEDIKPLNELVSDTEKYGIKLSIYLDDNVWSSKNKTKDFNPSYSKIDWK